MLLEECHLNKVTAATPNVEALVRKRLADFLLSYSAERHYVQTLLRLLSLELRNPGRKVDLSTGIVRLVDEQSRVSATTVATVQQAQA